MPAPRASIVVSTYRRAHLLGRLVAALDDQTVADPYEIIVVDNGSDDDTKQVLTELARCHPRLRSVHVEANRGPARGRNAGWRTASGEVVAFTDDDCQPKPDWLAALLDAITEADLVQGRVEPDPKQLDRLGPFSRTMRVDTEGYYQTANVAYRRAMLEQVGGFDERFVEACGEDTELALRAIASGATTTFASAAVVLHDVSESDYWAHLRSLRRWIDIPLVMRLRPEARVLMASRWWWKESHRPAVLAAAGLALACGSGARHRPILTAIGAALITPYFRFRMVEQPLGRSRRQSATLVAPALLADLVEVAVVVRGSLRHRTFVL